MLVAMGKALGEISYVYSFGCNLIPMNILLKKEEGS
jgi:hypothetical protein